MPVDLRCDFPCDDDCEADCHQVHLPQHKRNPDMCGCAARKDLRERYDLTRAQLETVRQDYAELIRSLGSDMNADGLRMQIVEKNLAFRDLFLKYEEVEAVNARVRALHPSREEADAQENAMCPECIAPAPCRTRRVLDGEDGP